MKPFVITIARSFGSGGKYIGTLLSQELNIPCYDEDLKKLLEEQFGIHQKHFQNMEDTFDIPSWIQMLKKNPVSEYVVSPQESHFISDVGLFKMQSSLLRKMALSNSYIVMGKCANHVLRNEKNVVSIYIGASKQSCIDSISKKLGSDYTEAKKLIEKTDKYRRSYYKYYTEGGKWDDPTQYDFTFNTTRLGRDDCVDMILSYVKQRFEITE